MWETWAPVLSAVLVAVVGIVVPLLNSRNDRALTDQEIDILRKLDPGSEAAKKLRAVIETRIDRWYRRSEWDFLGVSRRVLLVIISLVLAAYLVNGLVRSFLGQR